MTGKTSNGFAARFVRAVAAIVLVLSMTGAVAGCGRKARPEPRFGCAGCPKQTT